MEILQEERMYKDSHIATRLLKYAKPYTFNFIISLILILIPILADLLMPQVTGEVVEILGEDVIEYNKIIWMVVAMAVLTLVSTIAQYFQNILLQKTGQKIIYTVREDVFTHIEKLSSNQFNNIPVGKLVTRVTNDTNNLNELYTNVIISLIKSFLTLIGVIIMMFITNVEITLYILITAPFVFGLSMIFRKFSRKAYRDVRTNVTNVNTFLSENISGIKITQIFNQEEKKFSEFKERNDALRKSSLKEIFVFGIFRPTIYGVYIFTVIMLLWIGSMNNLAGGIVTASVIVKFYSYLSSFFNPLQELADQFNVLQSAFASSEKIFSILDMVPEIVDEPDAVELTDFKGEIEFKNVWFSYIKDEWVLKDVSFKVNANETVAFVGATGSGKTTILSLIVRNYDIQKGQILIDGKDIKNFTISSLRKNIGQMLQDVFLFSGTILSNIQLKDENISIDDVVKASKYVNADKFIDKLPDKYNEKVRERGNNFSSGQRQLISFARTIVHKPKLMILDEATANIDTETEKLIQDSLEKMMNIGTMLIVAHRLSTIQHADNIIVLSKGEIIEQGTHQELLKNKKHYYTLYRLQYEHKVEG